MLQPNGAASATIRLRIARVNEDGTLDTTFNPTANNLLNCLVLQADGKVLLGGHFTTLQPNGAGSPTTRNRIARVNADGTLDTTFDPNASSQVTCMAVQADGKVLLGGVFTTLQPNGAGSPTTRNRIARVNADGTLDMDFNPDATDLVLSVAVQADGKVLLGGGFFGFRPNGAPLTIRNRIARLNPDGTLDPIFNPNANASVVSLAVQADGKVLLGGSFTTLQPNGAGSPTTRNRVARLNADGTLDTLFDPNADASVSSVAVQADGKVLLGGALTALRPNGAASPTSRNRFARLHNDPATQNLSAPDTTQVQWQRGGAAPELSHVTFELSTDGGSNWSPIGAGARVGATANWQLTGLTLPASGLIRARGATTGCNLNGTSGLIEQVAAFPDTVTETPTLAAPASSTATKSPISVDFTLPEAALAGSVKLTFGATALTLAGSQESAGQHTFAFDPANPVASSGGAIVSVDGPATIADGFYTVTIRYQDAAGNPEAFAVSTNVQVDTATQTPTLATVTSVLYHGRTMSVEFTLPEAALADSVMLTFTGVGAPKVFTLGAAFETATMHSLSFDPDAPLASGHFDSATALPDGTYSVTSRIRMRSGMPRRHRRASRMSA